MTDSKSGAEASVKPVTQAIIRKDRSPMNPKVWVYQLACGHDVCMANGLLRKPIICHKCRGL